MFPQMSSQWTNKLILHFLDEYEQEPSIWNPNDPGHKDKAEVSSAWTRLSFKMQMPVNVLKRKKECLMATYRVHIKRVKESIEKGEEKYQPTWFAFKKMDQFLRPLYEGPSPYFNKDIIPAATLNPESELQEDTNLEYTHHTIPKTMRRRRRRYSDTVDNPGTSILMNELLNGRSENKDKTSIEDDECDLFGKLIAKKLRKFNGTDRDEIMFDIQGLIVQRTNEIASK